MPPSPSFTLWPAMRATGSARVGQRAALVLVDPALHRVDVGDRGEVQPAPPDEGADRLEECRTQREVAGHRARLDHGGALPVLAHALVVGDGGRQCDRGRRHGGIGAQPQVGAEDVAVGVARLHQRHQSARDARSEAADGVALGRFRVYCRRRVVEQHEVHIGRIIQFAGAELAHAEDREPPAACRIRRIGQAKFARVVRGAQQMRHGERQRGLRQIAQRRGDTLQRPDAADVGDGGGQRDDTLGAPHRGGDPVAARSRARPPPDPPSPLRPPRPGPEATSARRLAASRTARSARNGLLPPSAAQQRGDLRPRRQPRLGAADVRRSARPAAPPPPVSCGLGQRRGQAKVGLGHARNSWA